MLFNIYTTHSFSSDIDGFDFDIFVFESIAKNERVERVIGTDKSAGIKQF